MLTIKQTHKKVRALAKETYLVQESYHPYDDDVLHFFSVHIDGEAAHSTESFEECLKELEVE